MKKITYLCAMLLLSINAMAQIDLNDDNWELVIYDDFTGAGRGWHQYNFKELTTPTHTEALWCCFPMGWHCFVFTDDYHHQVYQPSQSVFTNGTLRLDSRYTGPNDLSCENGDFILPYGADCDTCEPVDKHYLSGMIESLNNDFGFGYYEIKYKTPVHIDAHAGFWLHGCGPNSYEEIDIMEYSKGDCQHDFMYGYSSGIWFNPNSLQNPENIGKTYYHLPTTEPNLGQYHTFGVEWMPEYVKWYRDNEVVSEYRVRDSIPQYNKRILVTYEIGSYDATIWEGSGALTIDYVKAYRLKTDCNSDVSIRSVADWQNYVAKVRRSIAIGSPNGLVVPSGSNLTMRATESITIDQPFELQQGTPMTLIIQECPINQVSAP